MPQAAFGEAFITPPGKMRLAPWKTAYPLSGWPFFSRYLMGPDVGCSDGHTSSNEYLKYVAVSDTICYN
jgi:hypothetical protein